MKQPSHHSQLDLLDYSSHVHLGCSPEERTHKQEVRFSVIVNFLAPPQGEETDKLEDTLCYAKVCKIIDELTASQHYNLVEKLACEILQKIRLLFPVGKIKVVCHKVTPPVPHLRGGVKYACQSE